MKYCPYCAESLTKPTKICPYCKKTLEFDLIKEMLEPGETSQIDSKIKLKIWYKEKSHIIYPFITLIIGFIAGAILLYGFAQTQFVAERGDYKEKIATLEGTIQNNAEVAGNIKSDLETTVSRKNQIIQVLLGQKDIYSRMIYFTNRLGNNSTITPNTTEDADYYKRNTLYLIKLFETSQDSLKKLELVDEKNYNLRGLPAFLE
ncbi:MAG: hypothetical protein KAT07_08560 [Calditrichia bacterium]|nr:hypothetical protein [Calditrichia bacterium]